jgi:hypothetical protein
MILLKPSLKAKPFSPEQHESPEQRERVCAERDNKNCPQVSAGT